MLKSPLDVLRAISATMENATRLGEFRRAVRAEGDTKAGLLRAASASQEVTTDFARHGAQTVALRLIAAFWNARVQGYDRLARAIKRNPVGTFARIGAGITLPPIILYAINRDDPEYWEIPQWQRDLFWHVKIDGAWVRIPKPFELGSVFGTIPERILEWIEPNDPEGLRESLKDFLVGEIGGTVLPSVTSVQPLFENLANYSLFFRRPIVPRSMQDVEPRFQATEQTSEIATLLGGMAAPATSPPSNWTSTPWSWRGAPATTTTRTTPRPTIPRIARQRPSAAWTCWSMRTRTRRDGPPTATVS